MIFNRDESSYVLANRHPALSFVLKRIKCEDRSFWTALIQDQINKLRNSPELFKFNDNKLNKITEQFIAISDSFSHCVTHALEYNESMAWVALVTSQDLKDSSQALKLNANSIQMMVTVSSGEGFPLIVPYGLAETTYRDPSIKGLAIPLFSFVCKAIDIFYPNEKSYLYSEPFEAMSHQLANKIPASEILIRNTIDDHMQESPTQCLRQKPLWPVEFKDDKVDVSFRPLIDIRDQKETPKSEYSLPQSLILRQGKWGVVGEYNILVHSQYLSQWFDYYANCYAVI